MKQVVGGAGVMGAAAQQIDEDAVVMADAGSLLRVSTFADGELATPDAQATLARLLAEPALREAWDEIHLVGDALRSDDLPGMANAPHVSARFAALLASEPVVLAPRNLERRRRVWLRYVLPMGAAAAAVLMVSWTIVPQFGAASLVARSTSSPTTGSASLPASASAIVDNAQLREYLNAHREFSAASWRSPGLVQPVGLSSASVPLAAPAR